MQRRSSFDNARQQPDRPELPQNSPVMTFNGEESEHDHNNAQTNDTIIDRDRMSPLRRTRLVR